jgi:uncharacterized repeat protein (TIGR01451 family)
VTARLTRQLAVIVVLLVGCGGGSQNRALVVKLSAAPDPVRRGQTLIYTIRVFNNGRRTLTAVTAKDSLPEGADWISWSPGCEGAGPVFTCSLGPLLPQASRGTTITVRVTSALSDLTSSVTVTAESSVGQSTAAATSRVRLTG